MFRHQADPALLHRGKHLPRDYALLIVATLYALLPFGRLLFTGEANQVDMGVGTILLFLVAGSLLDSRRRRSAAVTPTREGQP
jgi:hypothetical protein